MRSDNKVGRYEIISSLGAGGMGEVYRARDTRINREVAIKILPAAFSSNPERLRRFEYEAQATGALNHPNILVVHDIGTHEGAPFIVSELLAGQTLKERLAEQTVTRRKAINYALQIARGLSAAHTKGIIHRDLKPDNIFVTKDERIKILDFGLAKLVNSNFGDEAHTDEITVAPNTKEGMIVGTAGYMSPEQVRGETDKLDHRSDIFSFGVTFYEMLTGERAFRGRSAVETMNAILTEEPLERLGAGATLEPVVERVLSQCLKKSAEDRFQSAHDLAFQLELVQELASSGSFSSVGQTAPSQRRWTRLLFVAVIIMSISSAAFFAGKFTGDSRTPMFSQLTFRRGTIWSARFTPDEDTILYSASLDGNPIDVFSTRRNSSESRSLGLTDYSVLSVSRTGDLAILRQRYYMSHFTSRGTLARMPLAGASPRPLLNDVKEADWSPDGATLAIVRRMNERDRLEYPANKILYETEGWISDIRVSPSGASIAFLEHQTEGDDRGWIGVTDLKGNKKLLSVEWSSVGGLAWSPDESEIWFTAKQAGEAAALYAVTLSNKQRTVLRTASQLRLFDISRSGRVLLSSGSDRTDFFGMQPGETNERNLSWLDRGRIRDLSSDGKKFVFTYWGAGSGTNYITYIRQTDGAPAVPLGEGGAWSLSPNGHYVLAILSAPPQIILLPTGVGETLYLEPFEIVQYGLGASWLPDGERIVFIGREKGQAMRTFVQSIRGTQPQPLTPEGTTGTVISPDGHQLIGEDTEHNKFLYTIDKDISRPVKGVDPEDDVVCWSNNLQTIYIYNPREIPAKVYKLDLENGTRRLWKEIRPADPTGVLGMIHFFITPDGNSYVYDIRRYLSDLYIVEGLK